MKKIYLAVPYSNGDAKTRQERFERVNRVAAKLMREGFLVFSPISHTHPIALAGELPKGWAFWKESCEEFLKWADEVFVLALEGWKESVGVTAELAYAAETGKPVIFIREEGEMQDANK